VYFVVAGRATVDGTITANGRNGVGHQNAGGSGGGVYLRCKGLAGAGTLQARGGNGTNTSYPGGGGGGRIAVWATKTNEWSGLLTTNQVAGGTGYQVGETGTLVIGHVPPGGTVMIVR
jgi:hypothetical protein